MGHARTLLDKLWDAHLVAEETDQAPAVLYVDLHLVHEVTSPQAFAELRARGLRVRRPERTVATMDHAIPTRAARTGDAPPPRGRRPSRCRRSRGTAASSG
jgi:3-isopropylmalate/(R)-2-methylmalate dehydratase large subunit